MFFHRFDREADDEDSHVYHPNDVAEDSFQAVRVVDKIN